MEDKEMAEFLIRRVMHAPRGTLTGSFEGDLMEKLNAALDAAYVEEIPGVATGRYSRGYRATDAGKQFAVKNV